MKDASDLRCGYICAGAACGFVVSNNDAATEYFRKSLEFFDRSINKNEFLQFSKLLHCISLLSINRHIVNIRNDDFLGLLEKKFLKLYEEDSNGSYKVVWLAALTDVQHALKKRQKVRATLSLAATISDKHPHAYLTGYRTEMAKLYGRLGELQLAKEQLRLLVTDSPFPEEAEGEVLQSIGISMSTQPWKVVLGFTNTKSRMSEMRLRLGYLQGRQ